MKNVLLGKVLKSMQKLSGKSVTQLSDETGMTIDSINNLFYARVQKPGFMDILSLTCSMGFTVKELDLFINNPSFADLDCKEITAKISEYMETHEIESMPQEVVPEASKESPHDMLINAYENTINRQINLIKSMRKSNIVYQVLLITVLILIILVLIYDALNSNSGWFIK